MKIRGMEHLRKNDYNKLVIRKGRVNVYSESLIPTMKMSHSIEDELRTLDDVAKDAGTISYEIMSRLGKNPRFIKKYTGL